MFVCEKGLAIDGEIKSLLSEGSLVTIVFCFNSRSCLESGTSVIGTRWGRVLLLGNVFVLNEVKDGGAGLFFMVFRAMEDSLE